MIKVGITGQAGFVGTHLYNTLGLSPQSFQRVAFEDEFFEDENVLNGFISKCDAIVHLAAMNRHSDPDVIYSTNVNLVKKLINACEATNSKPHILFSSSTQEERDNHYGRSKREGRLLLESWAEKNNAKFSGLIIPNVYGPFGKPYYNSVVATFCYQLTHDETPKIDVDVDLKMIYVGELVNEIIDHIVLMQKEKSKYSIIDEVPLAHTAEVKVSELLNKLSGFKQNYLEKGIIPCLDNPFERNLYNTFLCYIDHKHFFPFKLDLKTDDRGSFVETVKLNSGGQVSFSTTKPGVTRGNHFHTRKAERFAVIKGKAKIEIRQIGTDKKIQFELDGEAPSFVDMPIWFTHNITNLGEKDLLTIFWISEHFDPKDPDTYFEKV